MVGMNEKVDPGPYQTGLDCSSGDQPVTEAENAHEKPADPPLPRLRTKAKNPQEIISSCSEKNFIVIAALLNHLVKQLQNNELQENQQWYQTSDFRSFMRTGESFTNALEVFVSHLPSCASVLERQIAELREVADAVDKTNKGVKIAGITGGATGAVGGAAAVAGILLSPVTMGASLAITAVGVGVAAAGGVTGASAAITNKVKRNQVRKKVETILKEYQSEMEDIKVYLNDINTEMGKLRAYDLLTLERVNVKSAKIVRLVGIAGGTTTALGVMSRSSGVIQGFALGMDLYFTEQDSQKLKKESKTRFAQQIHEVAGQIKAGLTELMDMREKLLSEGI
ncbi:apolipo L3-like protein [Labeo rohita]|nr:apolipo L3-like protein [Labeo rohita]